MTIASQVGITGYQDGIIRDFHGCWPNWWASLDDGRIVCIYIRYGRVEVGVGRNEREARDAVQEVNGGPQFVGVVGCTTALVELEKQGFYYVAPANSVREGA